MNIQNAASATETDAEIIGLLTAISVVSKRLANNLRKLQEQKNWIQLQMPYQIRVNLLLYPM